MGPSLVVAIALALLAGPGCEVSTTSSSDTSQQSSSTEDSQTTASAKCISPGAKGAVGGATSGMNGIRCSKTTCACSGFLSMVAGWRSWWQASAVSNPSTDGNVDVAGADCAGGSDTCEFRLDFGVNWYATMDAWFEQGSIVDVEFASTYEEVTDIQCSGSTYTCTATLKSGTKMVWNVGVAQQ